MKKLSILLVILVVLFSGCDRDKSESEYLSPYDTDVAMTSQMPYFA